MSHSSRRVMVTGGSAGIGQAIACAFRDAQHEVVITGRDEKRLRASGFPYFVADVCDDEAMRTAIRRAGPIDIFVANAGGATTSSALRTSREDWDRMLALNLTSAFVCAQAVLPSMIERGWGRFVALGSTASFKGYRYVSAYAAAKHGLLGFVRSLALELAKTGVTANAICPGYTDTPMLASAIQFAAAKTKTTKVDAAKAFTSANPMGRLIAPDEVAAAALWLASEAAASVNGQAVAIDGGETA